MGRTARPPSRVNYNCALKGNIMKLRNNQKIGINSTLWTLSGMALVACGGGGGGGGSISAGGSVRGGPPAITLNGERIVGTPSSDSGPSIDGTARNDVIVDYDGNNDIDARGGDDVVIASGEVDGGSGEDIIFGTLGNDVLNGGTGNDFLAGEGGDDIIRGGAGDDFVVSGSFGSDDFAELRTDVPLINTIQRMPVNQRIEFDDDTPDSDEDPVIMQGRSMVYGDAGDDLVASYTRASQAEPNLIFGDGETTAADDGDDIIVATSNSEITGGGGDDIFFLEVDQNNDLSRVLDFGNGDDQFVIIADRPLPSLQDVMNFYDRFDVTQFDNDSNGTDDSTRIEIIGTTDDGGTFSGTVELIDFTRDLERDDFLVMTEAEAIQLLEDTDAGPDVLRQIISSDII